MKKSLVVGLFIGLFLVSFVSAGFWGDFFDGSRGETSSLENFHSTDSNKDGKMSGMELTAFLRLFSKNGEEYFCDSSTEDGYSKTAGNKDCQQHSADLNEDWKITQDEVDEVIFLFSCAEGTVRKGMYKKNGDGTFVRADSCSIEKCKSGQKIGDVNGDGKINSYDATLVIKMNREEIAKPSDICCVDTNQDGYVSVLDFPLIMDVVGGVKQSPGVCGSNSNVSCEGTKATIKDGEIINLLGQEVSIAYLDSNQVGLIINGVQRPNLQTGEERSFSGIYSSIGIMGISYSGVKEVTLCAQPFASLEGSKYHSADYNQDGQISGMELTAFLRLFSKDGEEYFCDSSTEDGYSKTAGNKDCKTHDADLNEDWKITQDEVDEVIFLFSCAEGTVRKGMYKKNDAEKFQRDDSCSIEKCKSGQKIGDVNGDGKINSYDATLVIKMNRGQISQPEDICCVDTNQDGYVSVLDFPLIIDVVGGVKQSPGVCAQENCIDSDGGKDYYKKGTALGLYWEDTINEGPLDYVDSCSACDSDFENCKLVSEYFCREDGKVDILEYNCSNGCKDGACVQIAPTGKPLEIPEDISGGEEKLICQGCVLEKTCYPFGYRKSGEYCSEDFAFVEQLEENSVCDNSFECGSNVCVSGECVSEGLLKKILNWFRNFFG